LHAIRSEAGKLRASGDRFFSYEIDRTHTCDAPRDALRLFRFAETSRPLDLSDDNQYSPVVGWISFRAGNSDISRGFAISIERRSTISSGGYPEPREDIDVIVGRNDKSADLSRVEDAARPCVSALPALVSARFQFPLHYCNGATIDRRPING